MQTLDLAEPDRATWIDVNRTRLRVWEWGDEDAPPLLCVHGAHDHGRMWDGFAPRLAALGDGYRVLAIDIRGHGDSGRLAHGHVWNICTMDIGMLARSFGSVGVVGHSFGAGLTGMAAGIWPEHFRWLVNLDGLGPTEGDGWNRGQPTFREAVTRSLAFADSVLLGPVRAYGSLEEMVERRAQTNHRLPRPWVEHLVRHGARQVEGGWTWKLDPAFRTGFPGDFDIAYLEAELSLVSRPLLVLTGAEEDMWSDHSPDVIARRVGLFADARHQVIEDAGHYVHIEQPEVVLDAISRFLAEVGP